MVWANDGGNTRVRNVVLEADWQLGSNKKEALIFDLFCVLFVNNNGYNALFPGRFGQENASVAILARLCCYVFRGGGAHKSTTQARECPPAVWGYGGARGHVDSVAKWSTDRRRVQGGLHLNLMRGTALGLAGPGAEATSKHSHNPASGQYAAITSSRRPQEATPTAPGPAT